MRWLQPKGKRMRHYELVLLVHPDQIDPHEVQRTHLIFLQKITNKKEAPMCGNSICQDRRFLARLMPDLEDHFQYRNLDVTSIKITSQLWAPDIARSFTKDSNHLARDDIYDSINELKHYRNHFLRTED